MTDVGLAEDLIFGLKNLVALENHARESYFMNNDKKWLELCDLARNIRTRWLKLIVKEENSQIWCGTKHMLASIMALEECANRFYQIKRMDLSDQANQDASLLLGVLLEFNEIKKGGEK
jgi:hypothetical protein